MNQEAITKTEEMVTLANETFYGIQAAQAIEAEKAAEREKKNEYQQNKDALAELDTILTTVTAEKTDLQAKLANTASTRQ